MCLRYKLGNGKNTEVHFWRETKNFMTSLRVRRDRVPRRVLKSTLGCGTGIEYFQVEHEIPRLVTLRFLARVSKRKNDLVEDQYPTKPSKILVPL